MVLPKSDPDPLQEIYRRFTVSDGIVVVPKGYQFV